MSDTSLVFNVTARDRGVNATLTRTAANVRAANVAGAASTVALGAAMGSAAAHAVALGSSVLGAVGAVGLLPGAVAAVAATVVGAKAVTFGLADAWKATGVAAAGGGGRAANTARQVAAAHREVKAATEALADAQRTALAAQEAVTRARKDEAERLEDLSRSVEGARLDEEDAVAAVAAAERDLAKARMSGNVEDILAADRAYRQAQHTLADVRDRVEDLTAEQADSAAKGIEGSDAVQAALQRQEDAQRQVEQAAQRLADAQDAVRQASQSAASGGIDPAAQALARLSPNGRAVILTLRALAPAWQAAARAGQQVTFRGVASDLRGLSSTYLPLATRWLTRMGGSFNLAIRESAGLARTRGFVADVGAVTGNTSRAVDRLARAVRPVINGLMQWAAVGSSFLPGLAGEVGTIAQRFERWSRAARESGRMQQWIGNALGVLHQLGAIARDAGASVLAVFRAGGDGGSTLTSLQRGAALLRRWTESEQGQKKLAATFATLRKILSGLAEGFGNADAPASTFFDGLKVAGPIVGFLADHTDLLAKALPVLAAGFLLSRGAQTAANIATVVTIPLRIAEAAATWGLRGALRAHRTALVESTAATRGAAIASGTNAAATTAGDVATKRSLISMAAQKVAMVATRAATLAYAAAQWVLNAAMSANPIGLIIIAVIALVAGIVLLWRNSETFRKIVIAVWHAVWGAIKAAYNWVVDNWPKLFQILTWPHRKAWQGLQWIWAQIRRLVVAGFTNIVAGGVRVLSWFTSLPGRIGRGLRTVGSILTAPFRAGFNAIARLWNRSVGSLSFTAPSWVPGLAGKSFSLPKLPMLARGGTFTSDGGAAIVGENGPEVVTGVRGASVVPLPKGGGDGGSSGGRGRGRLVIVAGDREAVAELRRLQKQYGF
ncbi:hypothetical protein ACGFI9_21990 [Micromonospora sp. NPDC048930]|uniref:hypothetical protein n=1 Tax=Micromonospora sp. NPDC048930 TaxID=3364261 RepID=UPI00371BF9FF